MKIKTEADQGWLGGAIYWTAWDEDEKDGPLGHGRTEVEAIADLCDRLGEVTTSREDAAL